MDQSFQQPGFNLLSLQPAMVIESTVLPACPIRDPADRFLIAAARLGNLSLMTQDQAILDYAAAGHVQVIPA